MDKSDEEHPPTKVVFIGTNQLLWLGLQTTFHGKSWVRLSHCMGPMSAVDAVLTARTPDIVIIDGEMRIDGNLFMSHIKLNSPQTRVVLLTGFQSDADAKCLINVVDRIVLKVQPAEVLLATIKSLLQETQNQEMLARSKTVQSEPSTFEHCSEVPKLSFRLSRWPQGLTEREAEVVGLISEGLSNKDIANRLGISTITVRHHLTNVFKKLGVPNRQRLLISAHQLGITKSEHESQDHRIRAQGVKVQGHSFNRSENEMLGT